MRLTMQIFHLNDQESHFGQCMRHGGFPTECFRYQLVGVIYRLKNLKRHQKKLFYRETAISLLEEIDVFKLLALSPLMSFGSIHLHGNMYVQDIALIPYCHISLQLQDCILNQVYEIYRVCLQD